MTGILFCVLIWYFGVVLLCIIDHVLLREGFYVLIDGQV
jgi:hypothetical protein